MMRNIVFVNQATGYLTIDIINSFIPHFDKVALITGSIRVQEYELNSIVQCSKIVKYDRGNPRKKLLSWIIGTIQICYLMLFRYRKYEVFYITIPPTAYLLSLLLPNKFSILVFDVFPDVLKINNHKGSRLIYNYWEKANRILFCKAHKVFTIGVSMANLLAEYMPKDKIRIIALWTGLTIDKPVQRKENEWLRNLGLQNKYIVQYSGNIGYTHNVEILVDLAIRLKTESDIHFLIIGRGERYNLIQNLVREQNLNNVTILPFQPDEVLIYSLASANLGVVLLDEKTAHVSLPSKIYNLQAVAVPILGISPPDSELNNHLRKYKNGKCFPQNDMKGIARFILDLKNHPLKQNALSENSSKAAALFTKKNADSFYQSYKV